MGLVKRKKRKKSLVEDPDLIWCFDNDFWGSVVLFDDADNLDSLAEVEDIWN